jgi:hypothetical protein
VPSFVASLAQRIAPLFWSEAHPAREPKWSTIIWQLQDEVLGCCARPGFGRGGRPSDTHRAKLARSRRHRVAENLLALPACFRAKSCPASFT